MAQSAARGRTPKPSVEAILDAAERLFGQHGLEGASLRQIGTAAGSSNHFAVQYHFGDKMQLVRAIFERRLPALEVRRAQLLAETKRAGLLGDSRALMNVLLRPISEVRDNAGGRSYAAFLLGMRNFEGSNRLRMQSADLAPLTGHVSDLLASSIPHLPSALFGNRMIAASTVFLGALVDWDQDGPSALFELPEELMIDDAIDMATATITAPVSDAVRAICEAAAAQ